MQSSQAEDMAPSAALLLENSDGSGTLWTSQEIQKILPGFDEMPNLVILDVLGGESRSANDQIAKIF